MDEHELAWAAGFFDGDGWAALVREKQRRTGQPKAQINQGSLTGVPEVLLRFRDAVGVGRVAGPKVEDGREPLYRWVASSRGDVTRVGSAIGPWLSDPKRDQFASAVGLKFGAQAIDSPAWAAGLFDAEGCVSLCVHRSHLGYKVIDGAVTQGGTALPQELSRFRAVVDVGKTYGPYTQKGAREPIYRWRCQTLDGVRCVIHLLLPWLGDVKRKQAFEAIKFMDDQPSLPRGRPDWGSHKTHCAHGHEFATARIRPYLSRGVGVQRRYNLQCLVCTREQARARRVAAKMSPLGGPATC